MKGETTVFLKDDALMPVQWCDKPYKTTKQNKRIVYQAQLKENSKITLKRQLFLLLCEKF